MKRFELWKVIEITTPVLVGLLALGTFVLSFDGLSTFAQAHEVTRSLTWIWALIVDGCILAAALSVLRASLIKTSTWYAWALTIFATLISIAFNVLHVTNDLYAQLAAALPPAFLFFVFHLFTGQIKDKIKRDHALRSLSEIEGARAQIAQEIEGEKAKHRDDMTRQIEDTARQIEDMKREAEDMLQTKRDAARKLEAQIATRSEDQKTAAATLRDLKGQLEAYRADLAFVERPAVDMLAVRKDISRMLFDKGITVPEIATYWNVHVKTIQRDLFSENGHKKEHVEN